VSLNFLYTAISWVLLRWHDLFSAIGLSETGGAGWVLSIVFLVGIVVGGLASISGALYGALFIQFVPNIADELSKAAPWAIFGVFLIVFMYVMPRGIAGFLHLVWIRLTASAVSREQGR